MDFCVFWYVFSAVFVAEWVETDFFCFDGSAVRDGDDGFCWVIFTHFVNIISFSLDELVDTFPVSVVGFVKGLMVGSEGGRRLFVLHTWCNGVGDAEIYEQIFSDFEMLLCGVVLGVGDEFSAMEEVLVFFLYVLIHVVTCC